MKVPEIGNPNGHVAGAGKPPTPPHGRQKVRTETRTENAGGPAPPPAVATQEKQRGVIRLLQEGHFKGVADVRLRINFFDELSAIEHEGLAQAVQEGVPKLLDAVNGQIDELLASGELDEGQVASVLEAQAAFGASVQAVIDEFMSSGATSTDSLTEGLQLAFDTLAESLNPLLTALASPEEGILGEPAEPAGPEGTPVTEEPTVLSTFSEGLEGAFNAALEGLQGALESASTLPELSPPSGNGVAYEKFLAMYNELRGLPSPEAEPTEPPGAFDAIV